MTGKHGSCVALTYLEPFEQKQADARRLAACWNACEGLTTEQLECQTKKELTAKLIEVNREMLAALEDRIAQSSGMPKSCGHNFYCVCAYDRSAAAVKKAKEILP
jgi:hypothetical protein